MRAKYLRANHKSISYVIGKLKNRIDQLLPLIINFYSLP